MGYIATLTLPDGKKEIWGENEDWDVGALFHLLDKCEIKSFSIKLAPIKQFCYEIREPECNFV